MKKLIYSTNSLLGQLPIFSVHEVGNSSGELKNSELSQDILKAANLIDVWEFVSLTKHHSHDPSRDKSTDIFIMKFSRMGASENNKSTEISVRIREIDIKKLLQPRMFRDFISMRCVGKGWKHKLNPHSVEVTGKSYNSLLSIIANYIHQAEELYLKSNKTN